MVQRKKNKLLRNKLLTEKKKVLRLMFFRYYETSYKKPYFEEENLI